MQNDFFNLKKLRKEVAGLKYSIEHAKPELTADFYKDYKSGHGISKKLVGFALDTEGLCRREKQLSRKLKQIQAVIERLEREIEAIEDSELRAILRLYHIEGLTQSEIGAILHIERSTVSKKLKKFVEDIR
mgnify:FL=1